MTEPCRCGHSRDQHGRFGVMCMATDFAALVGTSPSGTCLYPGYRTATPWWRRLATRFRKSIR